MKRKIAERTGRALSSVFLAVFAEWKSMYQEGEMERKLLMRMEHASTQFLKKQMEAFSNKILTQSFIGWKDVSRG